MRYHREITEKLAQARAALNEAVSLAAGDNARLANRISNVTDKVEFLEKSL